MDNRSITATIDKVREIVRQTSDDSVYSDMFIYHLLLDERNLLIEREANKRKMRSLFNTKTICMPLVLSKDIPCDCVPEELGCYVLKSKYPIPKPVSTLYGDMIKVTSLDGSKEYSFKASFAGKYNKYSRLGRPPAYYTIYNDHLYLIGVPHNNLKAVLIHIIPEDPVSMDEINLCDETGEELGDTCFDPTQDTFNLDGHLVSVMIEMVLKKLGISLQITEDVTNNASSTRTDENI